MTSERSRSTASVGSLLLLDLAVLFLVLGHFVQLDDVSGVGGDLRVLPLGLLAAVCGVGSVLVAAADRRAGRVLGVVLLLGLALLLWLQLTDDGSRFVWRHDEPELVVLEAVVAVVALVLLVRSRAVEPPRPAVQTSEPVSWTVSWPARAVAYLVTTVVLVLGAAFLGSGWGDSRCSGVGDDCVEAAVGSLLFGSAALLAMVVLVVVAELTLWNLRRRTTR